MFCNDVGVPNPHSPSLFAICASLLFVIYSYHSANMSLSLTQPLSVWGCVQLLPSALCFYKCRCSSTSECTAICWNSRLITKSFPRQLLETKWVLWFDLIYKEQRSIIIWRRVAEEGGSKQGGRDGFLKREEWQAENYKEETSFHFKCPDVA